MSRNAVLSTLAVLIAALVLLGDATNVRSRRSEHEQHVLAGTVQQGRIEAEQLQKARECSPAEFPYHQMAVHGKNFKAAVETYAKAIASAGQPARANILDWAENHDFGYNEAVEGNGYKLAALYDGQGNLKGDIQDQTDMANAFKNKAQNPFYDANGVHTELSAVAKPGKIGATENRHPILAEDFGQLHEAYSALLFLDKKYATKAMGGYTEANAKIAGVDVAGMALIAGTLSGPNFGTATLDRIGSLHKACELLSQKKYGSKYSGKEGAAYRNLFKKMENVVNKKISLSQVVDESASSAGSSGLTIEQWFNGGFVGDFLYLLEYADGSICKQANCFAEFFAYGGVRKASKGGVGGGLGADASAQASWNAFWGGQEFFVNNIVHPTLLGGNLFHPNGPLMPGFAGSRGGMADKDTDKTGRDKVMAAMKQCDTTIFSTCTAFTTECTFAGGFWKKNK